MWQLGCVRKTHIGFLEVNLAGELFAHLIQSSSAPVSEPVEHTSTASCHTSTHQHSQYAALTRPFCTTTTPTPVRKSFSTFHILSFSGHGFISQWQHHTLSELPFSRLFSTHLVVSHLY